MRIRVFEADQNPEFDYPRRHISKSFCAKLLNRPGWQRIDARTIQAVIVPRTTRAARAPLPLPLLFVFDYPDQLFDPNLAQIPAMRYPMQIATRRTNRRLQATYA